MRKFQISPQKGEITTNSHKNGKDYIIWRYSTRKQRMFYLKPYDVIKSKKAASRKFTSHNLLHVVLTMKCYFSLVR